MASTTYRVFGIPVFSIDYELDPEDRFIRNTGGQFELAEPGEDEEYDEDYEEEYSFGFQGRQCPA